MRPSSTETPARPSRRIAGVATVAVTLTAVMAGCFDDGSTDRATNGSVTTTAAATAGVATSIDDATTDASTTAGVSPVPLRCSPAITPTLDGADGRPLVCAAARFLSKEEEVDTSGDYVLLTVSWTATGPGKLSVAVASSAPTLDNVFVTGELANADEVTQCSAEPNAGTKAVFVATAASGRCMVRQKVAQGASEVDLSLDITVTSAGVTPVDHVTATVHAARGA